MAEKNKFKAKSYMEEINEREHELKMIREKLVEQDEEMKELSLSKEKFRIEREFLIAELKS